MRCAREAVRVTFVFLLRWSGFGFSVEWSEGRWIHLMLYHWFLPMIRTS